MDVITAYRKVGTYRGAAEMCGVTHKTVKRIIEKNEAAAERTERRRNYESVRTLVAKEIDDTNGKISAKRLLPAARAAGYAGSDRNFRRLVATEMELLPAGAQQDLTAAKAKALLATVRPRDLAGRTRRQIAVDLVEDVAALDRKRKELDKRLAEAVAATGTTLTNIVGVGPVTAAAILGEVGDVRRFPSRHHFATYSGVAPTEVSSGDVNRHRLSRAGNRQLNHVLHVIALSNKRYDDRGREYYARKLAAGKGKKGAMRCLKRRLSDAVFRALIHDLQAAQAAGPGGHSGATTTSSAADRSPMISTSDKSLPGPAKADATPLALAGKAPS